MTETEITRVSTKGQIVIPKLLREDLKINSADEFLIYGKDDTIILKKIKTVSLKKRFQQLNKKLSAEMQKRKATRKDVELALAEIRRGN